MGRYTLADVKTHSRYDDAWTVLNGKVYNITSYLPFHQGGEKELMRCAGRDGTRLFSKFVAGQIFFVFFFLLLISGDPRKKPLDQAYTHDMFSPFSFLFP